jgi:hypothetical protein
MPACVTIIPEKELLTKSVVPSSRAGTRCWMLPLSAALSVDFVQLSHGVPGL